MSIKGFYYKYILFNRLKIIDSFLMILWIIGVFLAMYILIVYINTKENQYMLLSSLGIIISAFVASFSVMKSIYETKENEVNKFLLEQHKLCQELAMEEFEYLNSNLTTLLYATNGIINADDGEKPNIGNLGIEIFQDFESRKGYTKFVGSLQNYFPHLSVEFFKTINIIKQATDIEEIKSAIIDFFSILDKEQLKYILNKNKIRVKQ
jgi:hypothetical protein